MFDCAVHKDRQAISPPRERREPPLPPDSHIPGTCLPYAQLCAQQGHARAAESKPLKGPYCLYGSSSNSSILSKNKDNDNDNGNDNDIEDKWSVVEELLCLRLYDVYSLSSADVYAASGAEGDIAESIARCLRTRSVAAVAAFLQGRGLLGGPGQGGDASPAGGDGEDAAGARRRLPPKRPLPKKKMKTTSVTKCALLQSQEGYVPCSHEGTCTVENGCSCKKNGANCEKYCGCSFECCSIMYRGCRCRSSCNTGACPCFASGRECDPELCIPCGAAIHPCLIPDLRRQAEELGPGTYRMCSNVGMRRGERKRVGIGKSDVQGWGLFTCEPAAKGDLLLEYIGEVVTNDEAERRGAVYDKLGCSFLFDLKNDLAIDSTRLGNAVKFMNHRDYSKDSNCVPSIRVVDGEEHIGLFARRSIAAGEELTFDYGYQHAGLPDWAAGGRDAPIAIASSSSSSSSNKRKGGPSDAGVNSGRKRPKQSKKSA
jgi:hypothetical protein